MKVRVKAPTISATARRKVSSDMCETYESRRTDIH
jgi:hypothetical protein